MTQTYERMELVLHLIKYSINNWNICRDLKMIDLLLGLQIGYAKHNASCVVGTAEMINSTIFEKIDTHLKSFFEQDLSCFFT